MDRDRDKDEDEDEDKDEGEGNYKDFLAGWPGVVSGTCVSTRCACIARRAVQRHDDCKLWLR
eukprot:9592674-Lingulodinium_polyedra.AAC.1